MFFLDDIIVYVSYVHLVKVILFLFYFILFRHYR